MTIARKREAKHCSRLCHNRAVAAGNRTTGRLAAAANGQWNGGRSPAFYRRALREWCERCGAPAVLIHHRDRDHGNSVPANLESLCKRCHQIEHNCAGNLPGHQ